jgi:TonB family protein
MTPPRIAVYILLSMVSGMKLSSQDSGPGARSGGVCATHVEAPEYVRLARDAGLQGEVVVQVAIDADGRVKDSSVLSGHPLLAKEAQHNATLWTFTPGSERVLRLKYRFSLVGDAADAMAAPRIIFDFPDTVTIIANPKTSYPSASKNLP